MQQHRANRRVRARHHSGDALGGAEFQVVVAEELVAEAGRVQHQVVDGDTPLGRTCSGLARGVKTVQHLQFIDLWHVRSRRVAQAHLALFHQLHQAHAGQGLGGRKEGEHRIGGHGAILAKLARAGRAFIEILLPVGRHGHHAWGAPVAFHVLLEHSVQRGLQLGRRHFLSPLRGCMDRPQWSAAHQPVGLMESRIW
ncbi:hypothetical protein D9M69_570930 [compost metagenome]